MEQHDSKTWYDKVSTLSQTHLLAYFQEPTVIHKYIEIYMTVYLIQDLIFHHCSLQ